MADLHMYYKKSSIFMLVEQEGSRGFIRVTTRSNNSDITLGGSISPRVLKRGNYTIKDLDVLNLSIKIEDTYFYEEYSRTEVTILNEEEELIKFQFSKWDFDLASNLPLLIKSGSCYLDLHSIIG